MKGISSLVFLLLLVSSGLRSQDLEKLPDGTNFTFWDDQTHYTTTYHVNQNNPKASDKNDGTEELPFLTINHAAQVVKPGERVWIHSGIYREIVRPRLSGDGPEKMIAYEAAPGDQVVIRGSRIITSKWVISVDPNDSTNISRQKSSKEVILTGNLFSKELWMTVLNDSLFENGYFPSRLPNTTDEEFNLMPWATRWKGRIPYSLPRCLLFQEGKRMSQLAAFEDLVRLPGSYWVSPDGKAVHIHPFEGVNPNNQFFEVAVQEHIIQPQTFGLGFIRVSGLILEHCANGFLRSGVGALFTMGGHHWIIEGNTVRHINSLGIEIGTSPYETGDPRNPRAAEGIGQRTSQVRGQSSPQLTDLNTGHNIVRRNVIYDCGTAGIRGLGVEYALVEHNNIFDCGWQDAENHWEVAGIKLLETRGTLVRNNKISHLKGSCGIWLDYEIQNSRVTGNVIHSINTRQGAIFIEASPVPNMVDNNIMWNINGQGVRLAETDSAIVAHNLFGNVSEEMVFARVHTPRSLGGRKLTSKWNRIENNLVVNQGKPVSSDDPSNATDYNVYLSTIVGRTAIKDSGKNSVVIHGEIKFDEEHLLLSWRSVSKLPAVPLLKNCESDFFDRRRTLGNNVPGPFQGLSYPAILQLFDGLNLPDCKE